MLFVLLLSPNWQNKGYFIKTPQVGLVQMQLLVLINKIATCGQHRTPYICWNLFCPLQSVRVNPV